jgi:hypothetical protein
MGGKTEETEKTCKIPCLLTWDVLVVLIKVNMVKYRLLTMQDPYNSLHKLQTHITSFRNYSDLQNQFFRIFLKFLRISNYSSAWRNFLGHQMVSF